MLVDLDSPSGAADETVVEEDAEVDGTMPDAAGPGGPVE